MPGSKPGTGTHQYFLIMKTIKSIINYLCEAQTSFHDKLLHGSFSDLTPFEQEYFIRTGQTKFKPF